MKNRPIPSDTRLDVFNG